MKKFTIVWITQTLSEIGGAVSIFALTLYFTQIMYSDPADKTALAFAIAANNIVTNAFYTFSQPIVGVWTDRLDRKKILLYCNFLRGISTITLFVLMYIGTINLTIILFYSALLGILKSFTISSFTASVSMLVPEQHLSRANGMIQTSFSLSSVVAPTIATFVIGIPSILGYDFFSFNLIDKSISLPILIDGVTSLICALVLIFIFIPSPNKMNSISRKNNFISEFKDGFSYFNVAFLWLLLTIGIGNLIIPVITILYPIIVKYELADDLLNRNMNIETGLAILTTLGSIGAFISGIAIVLFGGLKKKRILGVIYPLMLIGIFMVGFGLSNNIYLTGLMAFLIFLMLPIISTHSSTIWQLGIPKEVQGKVFSVRRFVSQLTVPLSGVLAGLLGSSNNLGYTISILGLMLTFFSISQLFNKKLISIDDFNKINQLTEKQTKQINN